MRVMIAAGGTGGHIYPGIAVAKEILRRDPRARIRFVGTRRGLEARIVTHAGFDLDFIEIGGLKAVGLRARARSLWQLPSSFLAARRLIAAFAPDVVIGTGGYVTGPVLLAAWSQRVPTLVMESNALPGWTNRALARFVDAAAVAFEESLRFFRGKGVVTGNPVRPEFFDIPPKRRDPSRFSLLVFGGSQGARAINQAMVAALDRLAERQAVLRIRHQTGDADYDWVRAEYERKGWRDRCDIRRYIDDMVAAFAEADLIICRAGATTTAELVAAGKAAIMIPFPFAADDHQRRNAEALEKAGAARMILQKDLSGEGLANEIGKLMDHPERITAMEEASRKLARRDAAARIVDLVERLIRERKV
jgi:UDP-N-acetylglucosamine--N-acetylmuramyl-(pentapeptide) pyrophosphoryl-undecaprenol N-acetylglucosamine transferase